MDTQRNDREGIVASPSKDRSNDRSERWREAADDLWARLGGPADIGDVTRTGVGTGLDSLLPVDALAMGAVSVAGRAAAVVHGRDPGEVTVDAARVGSSFRADALIRLAGATPSRFAPLSGFFPAADGWVRTHANYRHHRERLRSALDAHDPDEVARAIAGRPAREVEDVVTAAGGIAVAVRTRAAWLAEPPGAAVAAEPLVGVRYTGTPGAPPPSRPRVLDLTRVIAGPVATRTLALAGADVLRIDPPGLPELPAQHVDTGIGKRTTVLDARTPAFAALLDVADVLVVGYRPGALDELGLDDEALRRRRPDLVVVRLDAWGWTGPWAGRRGFDSIVQAATGVADLHRDPDGVPGTLRAQALDHATGYLAAAAALIGLVEREHRGGSVREVALARAVDWLVARDRPSGPSVPLPELRQRLGDDEVPPPALTIGDAPGRWPAPAHPLGSDPARFAGT